LRGLRKLKKQKIYVMKKFTLFVAALFVSAMTVGAAAQTTTTTTTTTKAKTECCKKGKNRSY